MPRRVVITGLGTLTAAGSGVDSLWSAAVEGRSCIAPIQAFDAGGYDARIAGEVRDFKAARVVPKTYRKATKVMARDIELAVGAADLAVRDAGLVTPGTDPDGQPTYDPTRTGAHIGAGLIAADVDELTEALAGAVDETGNFDIHQWGAAGINGLTPLWLLKYLPNMLACHVTIIHDCQGPSNTITCGEASGGLSIAESVRVLQRDKADVCFCGGAESKINPMAFYRQQLTGRLTTRGNDAPAAAVRPFDEQAAGTVIGEGGGIIVIEAAETAARRGARVYAELLGYGATMSVDPASDGIAPDPQGRGIASAINAALADGSTDPGQVDAVVAFGSGTPDYDKAEASALNAVFGQRLGDVPVVSVKPLVGNCGAGGGGLDVAIACRMLIDQTLPARINCDLPIGGVNAGSAPSEPATLNRVLVYSTALGGQNVAMVLGRV